MKKLGIILMVIGLIQTIVSISNFVRTNSTDMDIIISACSMLILGSGLFFLGRYKKKRALEKGVKYEEIGWGKVIVWFFIVMIGIATIGRILLSVTESSFEGQVKRANKECPIPVAGGVGNIISIKAIDKQVVYTLEYDSKAINFDRISSAPAEYKRVIVLSSSLLNGQNGNGDNFMDLIIENGYGIKFIIISTSGDKFEISVTNDELNTLLKEAKDSPTEAMKEILEWQIKDEGVSLPLRLDEGLLLTDIFCDSINLIYRVEVEEPMNIFDISSANTEENRIEVLHELYSDPTSKANMDMCAVGKFNLIYRYVNSGKTDSCDMVFSHREIKNITHLPSHLNFK